MSSKLSVALRFSIRFNAAYSRSRFKVRMLFPDCVMRVRKSRFLIVKGEVVRGMRLGAPGPCTACIYSWLLWFEDRNLFSNEAFRFVVVSSWHSQLRVKFLSNFSFGLGSFPRTRRLHQVSSELSCTNPSTLDKLLTG